MTQHDFNPGEMERLRQLAKRAADEQEWAAALDAPGPSGDMARYLQARDDAVREVAPDLTEDLRNEVANQWDDDNDWHSSFDHPLELYTYVIAYRAALVAHGILVEPEPDEPFPTIEG